MNTHAPQLSCHVHTKAAIKADCSNPPAASSPHRHIFSVYACNLQSSKGKLVGEADDELSVLGHLGRVELLDGVVGGVDGWVVLADNSLVDEGRWESGLVGRGVVRAGVAALGVSVLGRGVLEYHR